VEGWRRRHSQHVDASRISSRGVIQRRSTERSVSGLTNPSIETCAKTLRYSIVSAGVTRGGAQIADPSL
jgi:hypothetical protein